MELTTDDRDAGLEAPDGRRFRPDRHGVITLPEDLSGYGARAAKATPLFRVRRRCTAGFDGAELRERYEAWQRRGNRAPAPTQGLVSEQGDG